MNIKMCPQCFAGRTGDCCDSEPTSSNTERTMLTIEDAIHHPATSYWLKNALKEALTRDPVDAVIDAELLATLLKEHCDKILKQG